MDDRSKRESRNKCDGGEPRDGPERVALETQHYCFLACLLLPAENNQIYYTREDRTGKKSNDIELNRITSKPPPRGHCKGRE
jgi:hypothetical protein